MSYEPTLVIKKKDLLKNIELIESELYDTDKDTALVASFLVDVNKYRTISFGDLELVICKPEFTFFNSLVRDKLRELGIEFQCDN